MLEWQLEAARLSGITDIVVVGGYRSDQLEGYDATLVVNDRYESTNMVESLFCAESYFGSDFVLSYGDIVYGPTLLRRLMRSEAHAGVVIDRAWRSYWEMRFENPLDDAESLRITPDGRICSIGQIETDADRIEGQYIGLMRFRSDGIDALRDTYRHAAAAQKSGSKPFSGKRTLDGLYMTDLLQGMIGLGYHLTAVPVHGGWLEIDSTRDLAVAETLLESGRLNDTSVNGAPSPA